MANFNYNMIIIGGRLTADPEIRQTQDGTLLCNFTVAVTRQYQKGSEPVSDFFNCTAWRQRAELISRYFYKGSSICVTGTLQNRSWTDKEGVKRFATDIVVNEVNFVDSKGESPAPAQTQQRANNQQSQVSSNDWDMYNTTVDDDVPF